MAENILFIFSDQHRHNVMGCMGHPTVHTPNLDRLAAEGVLFRNAWCQSPVCQPSRASVITGRYPHQIDLTTNREKDLDPVWPTAMKQVRAMGYETATFGKTHYMSPSRELIEQARGEVYDLEQTDPFIRDFGWDHVMEEYDKYMHISPYFKTPYMKYLEGLGLLEDYQQQIRSINRLTPDHWRALTSVLPREHDLTSFIASRAMDWLKNRTREKPFLAKVAFVQPHVPLVDDPDWAAYYSEADIQVPDLLEPEVSNDIWGLYLGGLKRHSQTQIMDKEFVRNGTRHYYGMISLIDQKIGEMLDLLDTQGQLDDTWIIYSADHGEMLGEHHLWAKMNFYKGSVQTPLIIRPPGDGRGLICDDLVELTDISATMTDIAAASPVPHGEGRSLIPAIRGGRVAREFVFSTIKMGARQVSYSFSALRNHRYRFTAETTTGTPCELFDLQEDPQELHNRVNDIQYQDLVKELHEEVLKPHLAR